MTGQGSSSCGACKFLRRRCTSECVFAPYFSHDEAATHFAAVHKVFGASNVSKLLLKLPEHNRSEAARSISFEALARMGDPVYGCVAHIFALQEQIASLQEEIELIGNQLANLTFGVPGLGSSEISIASHANYDIQFSSEEYYVDPECYQNYELATTLVNQSGYTAGSHDFESQMNLPPSFAWEDQNPALYPYQNPAERLLEGVNDDVFTYCSWLDMETAQTGIIPASGNIFTSS